MHALSLTARAAALAGATVLSLATLDFGHGGTYRGPGDTVPPGGGGAGGGGTGPPTPGGSPGGPGGPGGPVTGPSGPPTPGGGPGGVGGATTPGSGGDDLTAWTFWWEFNKEPYLLLKDALSQGPPATGSDGWFLSQSNKANGLRVARALTDEQRQAIQEALLAALASERHNDIVTGCLIALSKLGEVKEESGRSRLEEAFLPHLRSQHQDVAETAALALGILGNASAHPHLAHLLQDDAQGRELVGEAEVPLRTRAFAAYALALLGARTADEDVKRAIVQELVLVLESKASAMRDVAVACVISLGLVPLQPFDAPVGAGGADGPDMRPAASRAGQLAYLQAYLQDEEHHALVRAHAPAALARLLADLAPDVRAGPRDAVAETLLDLLQERSRESAYVRQSAILALGQLGDNDRDALDARIRTALGAVSKEARDQQERAFALIALAQVGGRPGTGEAPETDQVTQQLLAALVKGSAPLRPWAGLAIGVRGRALAQADLTPPAATSAALRERLAEERNPAHLGAYAIGLGIQRDREARVLLQERLREGTDDTARGYLALALGLLGDRSSVDVIQQVIQDSKYRPELLKQAAIALGLLGDQDTVPLLIDMLQQADVLSTQAALASALGTIGDARSVEPLLALLKSSTATATARGFAAVALGIVADKEKLPWNSKLSVDLNYRATTSTLNDPLGTGILNIL